MSARLALAALLLAGTAASPALADPAPAMPAVPPVAFTERTLANGLRIFAIRDTTTPNVAIQVWYDVGGRDDPAGRSGFAHLFEHLMFKATRNLVPEQFDRLTEDVGGYNNASTDDDYTNYYEVVPANHLERLLFAEADRMASLVVEPTSFASERDVVKEEYRTSVLSRPYGKLYNTYLPALSYQRHPYARGVIGSIENLDAATIDDVRAFHATYYRPDNAILVVAGNFDAKTLDNWVDQYFAPIKKPAGSIPRVTVDEPIRAMPVTRTVHEPNTPLPAIVLSFPAPPDRNADVPALMVLDAILSTGESSRLYQSLVYKQGLAQSAEAELNTRAGPGLFAFIALAAGGKDPATLETALGAELARVRDTPVTAAELAEAKAEITTSALKSLQTAEGKARSIASAVIIDGDPRANERQLAAIQRVTAADVQRVARTWLAPSRQATLRYLPTKEGEAAGAPITVAATVQPRILTVPRDVAIVTPASATDRIALPPLGAPVTAAVPTPVVTTLRNGLKVITVARPGIPLISARLVAPGGAVRDAAGKDGTASLTAELLTKGTTTRSATQIANDAESLGASIGSDADIEGATLGVTVVTPAIGDALAILGDVARHPAFAADELERARAQAIDAAAITMTNPSQVAGLTATRALFGASPYGAVVDGTPVSLKAITAGDIRSGYAATWTPASAALVMVGDITPAAATALAERTFGDWRATAPAGAALAPPAKFAPPRVIIVDMPGTGQAGVVVAAPALARADPDYFPTLVANTLLGGGFSSRLNQEIRIKRGLSYGAGSNLSPYRVTGSVSAGALTKNASAGEVVALVTQEMKRLGSMPAPTAAEITTRKSVLIGGFGRTIETDAGLGGIIAGQYLDGLGPDALAAYVPSVERVTPDAIVAAAARTFDPARATIVVAGDAKLFADALRKVYPTAETVPLSALDLEKPVLR